MILTRYLVCDNNSDQSGQAFAQLNLVSETRRMNGHQDRQITQQCHRMSSTIESISRDWSRKCFALCHLAKKLNILGISKQMTVQSENSTFLRYWTTRNYAPVWDSLDSRLCCNNLMYELVIKPSVHVNSLQSYSMTAHRWVHLSIYQCSTRVDWSGVVKNHESISRKPKFSIVKTSSHSKSFNIV